MNTKACPVMEDEELFGEITAGLARILSGGNVPTGSFVSEQVILDLEREVFLSLCGEQKTRDRIQHMLTSGKPLRN